MSDNIALSAYKSTLTFHVHVNSEYFPRFTGGDGGKICAWYGNNPPEIVRAYDETEISVEVNRGDMSIRLDGTSPTTLAEEGVRIIKHLMEEYK